MPSLTKRITMFTALVAILIVAFSVPAHAERRHREFGVRISPRPYVHLGIGPFYDPFWDPFYPYGIYPYGSEPPAGVVRVKVVPKHAEVFVDGYFAGEGDKVRTTPGGHAITLYMPGYRTVTHNVYVSPGSTVKMQETMDRLAAGEVSAPPPPPAQSPKQPPAGTPRQG